jgi:Ohr subfamily peroxiredoxin
MSEAKLKNNLYTTTAVATGGRNGHTRTNNGSVSFDLSIPKAMGGPGKAGTTTPEDLFAAGYAACFGSACEFAAKNLLKLNPTSIEVHADVTIGNDDTGGFALAVALKVKIGGLPPDQAKKVVETGHQVCPYSKATRGNIHVILEAQ